MSTEEEKKEYKLSNCVHIPAARYTRCCMTHVAYILTVSLEKVSTYWDTHTHIALVNTHPRVYVYGDAIKRQTQCIFRTLIK